MSVYSEEEVSDYEYYSDNCSDDDAGMVVEPEMEEEAEMVEEEAEKHYTVLREETIKNLQENDISEVSNILSVSRSTACTLLLHKSWNVNPISEEWFSDGERLRNAIGISSRKEILSQNNYCKICMENVEIGTMLSAACSHLFCSDCLKSYVSVSINEGPGCLMLRCPEPKCKAYADIDLVNTVSAADDKQIYYNYFRRSYVELSKNRKWCPAPGCDCAVEFDVGGSNSYDVSCDCSYTFCWNCGEEAHRPVACATVAKWVQNTSEAQNTTWIMAYTKPCPKCKRNIEKNDGCQHMTCSMPCGYEFCWLCLDKWTSYKHISMCNKYVVDAKQSARQQELKRYSHYFERWASNHRSRGIAAGDLARARDEHVPLLREKLQEGLDLDLQFVVEAWEQIVECRRVLKWTYAYGFFIDEAGEEKKKTFFECLKEEAETALERLHHFAENEMKQYIESENGLGDFFEFRRKLRNLTSLTRNFFESFIGEFEDDLCRVESSGGDSPSKKEKVKMQLDRMS